MTTRGRGRPYATHTKLGRLMEARGLTCNDLCRGANTYTRALTEYLAGRRRPSAKTMIRLCDYFRVPPEKIYEDEYPWTPEMYQAKLEREIAEKAVNDALAEHRRINGMRLSKGSTHSPSPDTTNQKVG